MESIKNNEFNLIIKEAIREYNKEKEQEERKQILHNTKLLLKYYNDFKSYVENAKSEIEDLDIEEYDEKDRAYILSIRRSKLRTLIMVAHIDNSLEVLKNKQYENCTMEKYKALELYFIENKTHEVIAEELNCGKVTPRRWINEMLDEMSVLLFGIDGLKKIV